MMMMIHLSFFPSIPFFSIICILMFDFFLHENCLPLFLSLFISLVIQTKLPFLLRILSSNSLLSSRPDFIGIVIAKCQ